MAYNHKTDGIMALLGLGDYVLPIDSIDPVSAAAMIRRALDHRAAIVEQAQNTLEETRQSTDHLKLLLHMGLSENEKLVAQWRQSTKPEQAPEVGATERMINEPDPWDPAYPNQEPPIESPNGELLEAL